MNKIEGKFWMIQSDVQGDRIDGFGRKTVAWAGQSIYESKKDALEACKAMAVKNPGRGYFVMEAVSLTVISLDTLAKTTELRRKYK